MAIKVYNIAPHTPEWYNFRRTQGIGGSEIGAILGLDNYKCAQELWGQKVGVYPVESIENEAMFWGREHEDAILEKWCYYDGRPIGYINNYMSKDPKRMFKKVQGVMVNDEYPWLFANVDALIPKGMATLLPGGKFLTKDGVLEAKTISSWVANQWESGLPPTYAAQLQLYLLVSGADYGEFAVLKDGRNFEVFAAERDDNFCDVILTRSYDFWYDHVIPGREYHLEAENYKQKDMDQLSFRKEELMYQLEPAPDETEVYKEFLKKRYEDLGGEITGTEFEYRIVKSAVWLKEFLKGVEEKLNEKENHLKRIMGTRSAITFGNAGKVTWKKDKDGTRSFRYSANIRDDVDDRSIDNELAKIKVG